MNNRTFGFASLLAVIGVSIVFGMILGGRQLAPAATGPGPTLDFADVVERAMPAVVSVRSINLGAEQKEGAQRPERNPSPEEWFFQRFFGEPDGPQVPPDHPSVGEGSGFIISDDGYLLTNLHVVERADDVRVRLSDGREFKAKVVGTDPSIDLALLKVDPQGGQLPRLPLGDSSALRVGEWVIAIGNPLEFEHTVTAGVLSAKERRVAIGDTDTGVVSFLQTDAAINFGNSGGPLLDIRGNVVGINTAIRRSNLAEGIGFALPINHARMVIDQLRERGYVRRGYIGINMNPEGIDEEAREYLGLPDAFGVLVDAVTRDGPADKAGLEPGDVIRKVDGDVVKDNLDLIAKIASKQPGDDVTLEVFRKEGDRRRTLTLEAELADREESLRAASNRDLRSEPRGQDEPQQAQASALGVTVSELSRSARQRLGLDEESRGLIVVDVEFNSQAAEKGITRDMVVTAVNDKPLRSLGDWRGAVDPARPGAVIKLDVLAGARSFTVFLRVPDDED
jgi:serine protease Do